VTSLVTSRPPPKETCDDVHDPQTLCPSVSLIARRPLGPSSGNWTASRSRLSFAWSPQQSLLSRNLRRSTLTVILPSSTNPTFFSICIPSFDISCGTPHSRIDFLSLLVTLYRRMASRCDNCLLLLPLVRISKPWSSFETDYSTQARRSYCLGCCNLCGWDRRVCYTFLLTRSLRNHRYTV
jgi:hypothetical protein